MSQFVYLKLAADFLSRSVQRPFSIFVILLAIVSWPQARADSSKYQLVDGVCRNDNGPGYNEGAPGVCSMLNKTKVPNREFDHLDIRGSDLSSSNLESTIFKDSNLSYCRLNEANLEHAVLKNTPVVHGDFRGAKLNHAQLSEEDLSQADFRGVKATLTSFRHAILRSANLTSMSCNACDFSGADLRGARLVYSAFVTSHFDGALYDAATQFPFPIGKAEALGMKKSESPP